MKHPAVRSRLAGDSTALLVGFALTCGVFLASLWLTDRNTHRLAAADGEVDRTHRVITGLERLLSTLKDAETGTRGFVITGDPAFLQPYDAAVGRVWGEFDELQQLTSDHPAQQDRLALVRQRAVVGLAELKEVIALRRADADAASAAVRSGRGTAEMDAVRTLVAGMQDGERRRLAERGDRAGGVVRQSGGVGLLTAAGGVCAIGAVFYLLRRNRSGQRTAAEPVVALMESLTEGLCLLDREYRFRYVNAAAERTNGMGRDELLGRTQWEVFPACVGTVLERELRRAMVERVTTEFENHYAPWDRWFALKAYPTPDGGIGVLYRDVTAGKRAELLLRAGEERFRLAADAVAGIIYEYDIRTGHVERTRGLYEVVGYHAAEVPPTAAWWAERTHPDDRERLGRADPDAVPPGPTLTEYRVRHKDGRWLHVEDRAVVVRGADGRPAKLVGCTVDVTERKRGDALFRELADAMPQIVYVTDADGTVVFVNRQWLDYTGQPDAQTADLGPVVHPDDLADMLGQWERAKAAVTAFQAEFRLRRAAGEYRWFLTRAVPVRDGGGLRWYGTSTDIHDRMLADQAVRVSEARLRRVFESNVIGMIRWDLDRSLILGANAEFLRMTGYTRDDVACDRLNFRDLTPPEWTARNEAGVRTIREQGFAPPYEKEYFRKDGSRVALIIAGTRFEDSPSEGMSFLIDMTETKRTEAALRRSEERLRLALDAAELGAWNFDPETFALTTDERSNALFSGSLAPLTYAQAVAHIHQDDRQRVLDAIAAPARPTDPVSYAEEFRVVHPDGSVRWVFVKGRTNFEGIGRAVRFDGTVADITERKKAEKEREDSRRTFSALIERCPFGIYVVDADFRIATINDGSQTGAFANVRPAVGRRLDEALRVLWPEPVATDVIHHFRRTLDTGEPYYSKDFVNPRADIDLTEGYEWELHRISLPDGRDGVVCYYYDSTRLRQVEQALKEADRKKDEFLATLAHELRNPLAPLRNGLQVIRLAGANGTVEQARIMMERQLSQMVRLVDDLLDVSRITRGKLDLRRERVELKAVIDAAVETARPVIEGAGHAFVLTVPDEPVFVDGDSTRLAQVVSNLLNNSAKYTRRGGHVRLTVGRDGDVAVVTVTDDGIGIPPAMLGRVFALFTQVDRTLEKTTGGLGIGLSLVKGLVEMHGGTVEARSDGEGTGSEFVVRLPVAASAPGGPGRAGEPAEEAAPAGRRRILVVDDNVDAADSLGQLLELLGNEVRTAYDGEAGVDAAGAFRPDVVLCDIGMPKVNGYDAARRIRGERWGRGMVLVALTGWGQEDDRQKSADAGFDHHLVKPVETAALMKLLAGLDSKS